jgi:DeoR/GlpR family transcriptional regulator of sugar metabolism
MLTEERKALLLTHLKKDGRIVAKSFSKKLKLSEDTIRRDLRELAAEGLLTRVHGGALPASPTIANLASRRTMALEEKQRLGRAGARLMTVGSIAFVDGGTTNLEMVKCLPLDLVAKIITHSPGIACALENHANIDVILIGGKLFRHSMVATGAATFRTIQTLNADMFFLGLTGLHPDMGLTTGDFEEAELKQAIMARAAETIVLATSEKLGAVSAHKIAKLQALSTLVVVKTAKVPKIAQPSPKIVRAI